MTKRVSRQSVRASSKRQLADKQYERQDKLIMGLAAGLIALVLAFVAWQLTSARSGEATTAGLPDEGERPLAALEPAERDRYYDAYPAMVINPENSYEAIIRTEKGDMRLRLFPAEAPLAVNNLVFLARQGFYDGTRFHRVLEDFMAQGGDPTGAGSGGPGYVFADETENGLVFDRPGLLAMAKPAAPDSNGSQFFITFAPTPHLDGIHTIFGELIEGEDVLRSLSLVNPEGGGQGDLIERIDILEEPAG
ncbi:MAG: peptidylprolyl isomerase [Candidatus Promineifilaceae bacterium]